MGLVAGELRVVSYNIHHGVGLDGKLDLDRIAEVLRRLDADVITLQEVDKKCQRSGNVDQTAYLAEKLGLHAVFGKAINLGTGEYGHAVLSRHAINQKKVHRLPSVDEQRIALEVKLQLSPEKTCRVVSVHFHVGDEQVRLKQGQALHDILKVANEGLLCLMGDFNAEPTSKTMEFWRETAYVVAKQGASTTYPADKPTQEIDYCVLVNGQQQTTSCVVVDEALASDHRPILAVIKY